MAVESAGRTDATKAARVAASRAEKKDVSVVEEKVCRKVG